MTPATHCTLYLVQDVRLGSRRAPDSGHNITGQDIKLNFPDAQLRCRAGLRSSNVAGFTALGTLKSVSVTAQDLPCSATAAQAGTLARLAMNATAVSKSVQTDHIIFISCHQLGTESTTQCRASQWRHQNEIKSIIAKETCNKWRKATRLQCKTLSRRVLWR